MESFYLKNISQHPKYLRVSPSLPTPYPSHPLPVPSPTHPIPYPSHPIPSLHPNPLTPYFRVSGFNIIEGQKNKVKYMYLRFRFVLDSYRLIHLDPCRTIYFFFKSTILITQSFNHQNIPISINVNLTSPVCLPIYFLHPYTYAEFSLSYLVMVKSLQI